MLILLINVGIIIVDHSGGQLVAVGHGGGGVGFKETGADHAKEHDGGHQNNGKDNAECGLDGLAQALFRVLSRCGLGSELLLALFLFTGCAHDVVHSSHTSCSRQCDTKSL